MRRVGEFPPNGLEETQELMALRKAPADVMRLLEEVVAAGHRLEKRSRTLNRSQLYDIQQKFGLAVAEIQRAIYARLAQEGK
jgi:hypothetical protein